MSNKVSEWIYSAIRKAVNKEEGLHVADIAADIGVTRERVLEEIFFFVQDGSIVLNDGTPDDVMTAVKVSPRRQVVYVDLVHQKKLELFEHPAVEAAPEQADEGDDPRLPDASFGGMDYWSEISYNAETGIVLLKIIECIRDVRGERKVEDPANEGEMVTEEYHFDHYRVALRADTFGSRAEAKLYADQWIENRKKSFAFAPNEVLRDAPLVLVGNTSYNEDEVPAWKLEIREEYDNGESRAVSEVRADSLTDLQVLWREHVTQNFDLRSNTSFDMPDGMTQEELDAYVKKQEQEAAEAVGLDPVDVDEDVDEAEKEAKTDAQASAAVDFTVDFTVEAGA